MDRYKVRENPEYSEERSTGKLIMNIPRVCKYSIIDTQSVYQVIANIPDNLPNNYTVAKNICKMLNTYKNDETGG